MGDTGALLQFCFYNSGRPSKVIFMLDFDWLDNLNVEVYNPVNVFDEQAGIFESGFEVEACYQKNGVSVCGRGGRR